MHFFHNILFTNHLFLGFFVHLSDNYIDDLSFIGELVKAIVESISQHFNGIEKSRNIEKLSLRSLFSRQPKRLFSWLACEVC